MVFQNRRADFHHPARRGKHPVSPMDPAAIPCRSVPCRSVNYVSTGVVDFGSQSDFTLNTNQSCDSSGSSQSVPTPNTNQSYDFSGSSQSVPTPDQSPQPKCFSTVKGVSICQEPRYETCAANVNLTSWAHHESEHDAVFRVVVFDDSPFEVEVMTMLCENASFQGIVDHL